MKATIITGSIADLSVVTQFASISSNAQDWLEMVLLAHNQSNDLQLVYSNISSQENAHVHANTTWDGVQPLPPT